MIGPQSKEFLVSLFTELRNDLVDREGLEGQHGQEPEKTVSQLAIFDALLSGLAEGGTFSDNAAVREYVAELAKATDRENEYEHVVREHRALEELLDALSA